MPPRLSFLLAPSRNPFQCVFTTPKITTYKKREYYITKAAYARVKSTDYASNFPQRPWEPKKRAAFARRAVHKHNAAYSTAPATWKEEDVGGGLEDNALPPEPAPKSNSNSRWLSEVKKRIGKCIMFGMDQAQTQKASKILKILGEEWRELIAGREGFLTGRKRAGLRRQQVVWGEMDSMNHVNNVTYTRYAESARINWALNYATHIDPSNRAAWSELWTPNGHGLILGSIKTEYKFPMTWPDHVSVFHKLRSLPSPTDTSFILDVMIVSELRQRPAARCTEDIVVYDYKMGKKTQMPSFLMGAFAQTWVEQEAERVRVEKKCEEVEGVLRELEIETWDRLDAKEDLGSR